MTTLRTTLAVLDKVPHRGIPVGVAQDRCTMCYEDSSAMVVGLHQSRSARELERTQHHVMMLVEYPKTRAGCHGPHQLPSSPGMLAAERPTHVVSQCHTGVTKAVHGMVPMVEHVHEQEVGARGRTLGALHLEDKRDAVVDVVVAVDGWAGRVVGMAPCSCTWTLASQERC